MQLYLDLDGVLTNWEGQFKRYTGMSADEYKRK